ncbi:MAG: catechol 1,2-dioxygenase [Pseudomonadota bacterium]
MNAPDSFTTIRGQQRAKLVLEDLEKIMLDFVRKHQITHDEYRIATGILTATVKAGEETLLYDVFLEAEATDIGNLGREGSPQALEGPFHLPGAPLLQAPYVLPQRPGEAGDILLFCGSVTDDTGKPMSGAEMDVWQADAQGLYSNIHPGIPDWNLRGRFVTDEDGFFEVRSIVPPPYEIPKNGPTGQVLKAMSRHFFRPAHLHVKVHAAGCLDLTTQLYFSGGQYLENDVANGVRDGLVTTLTRRDSQSALAAKGLDKPYIEVRYDFVLKRRQAGQQVAAA